MEEICENEFYHIRAICDSIETELENQGKPIPKDELYYNDEYYKKHQDELIYRIYPKNVQEKLKLNLEKLKIIYEDLRKISKYINGDISETEI